MKTKTIQICNVAAKDVPTIVSLLSDVVGDIHITSEGTAGRATTGSAPAGSQKVVSEKQFIGQRGVQTFFASPVAMNNRFNFEAARKILEEAGYNPTGAGALVSRATKFGLLEKARVGGQSYWTASEKAKKIFAK